MLRARQCLDELSDLNTPGDSEKGAELLDRVTDLFFFTAAKHTSEDKGMFGEVMERIAFDSTLLARIKLSERISMSEAAPVNLIRRLARDEIIVARPVLQYSPCLREGDLVAITSNTDQDHLMAAAHRNELTKPVTDIIVARGEVDVLRVVIRNTGADFSPESRNKLEKNPELQDDMQLVYSTRRDLAPSPIARLKRLNEKDFWQNIIETALMTDSKQEALPPVKKAPPVKVKVVESDAEDTDAAGQETGSPDSADEEPKMTFAPVAAEKPLVVAARGGEVPDTIAYFSKITGLDEAMIEHCLFKAHVPALMVLCKAHSLAPSTFTAMLQLRVSHTGIPVNDTAGLMRRYEGMTPDTAQRIIHYSDKRRDMGTVPEQTDAA